MIPTAGVATVAVAVTDPIAGTQELVALTVSVVPSVHAVACPAAAAAAATVPCSVGLRRLRADLCQRERRVAMPAI